VRYHYLARKHSEKTLRELGGLTGGMQYPVVTMAIRRLAKRLETKKALARKVKRVEKMLLVKQATGLALTLAPLMAGSAIFAERQG
jgi:hypothetical protein